MGATEHLSIVRRFDAPAERVFRAWSDPAVLRRWAWGSLGAEVTAEVDLRVGGAYRVATSRPDGATWAFGGTYLEIEPGRRLVCSLAWDAPMGYESPGERITVELAEKDGKTEMVFLHEGVPDADARLTHETGWRDTFDRLDTHLRQLP